jgi:ParB-like nuclease domain
VDLLPLDETRRRLRVTGQTHVGLREIPVDRIVGSVNRELDFDRNFKPRRGLSRGRLAGLRRAFSDGVMPPISVFEVGGAYFVEDGHHRVAVARERGADFIDAEVIRLQTNYEVPPEVDVARLVHTEQQRLLLEESGLGPARPDAVIEFSLLDGYSQLLDIIKAHGYDLARRRGTVPTPEEVAGDWYDSVYLPGVQAARDEGLTKRYESWGITDADLFLWLYQLLRDLRAYNAAADFHVAARQAMQVRFSRQQRQHLQREGRRPLPPRSP